MTATGLTLTADDLLRMPSDGKRYELVNGELHEMPPAGSEHGYVALETGFRLRLHLHEHPEIGGRFFAAETGYRLTRNPDTVRAPDVAYVAADRLDGTRVRGFAELAPDFIVEVVSPSDTAAEIQAKVDQWLQAGVRLAWVIYPATRSALVYRANGTVQLLHEDDALSGEDVLPGFSCRLGDLF
jgi:Uma2 family endonuclease